MSVIIESDTVLGTTKAVGEICGEVAALVAAIYKNIFVIFNKFRKSKMANDVAFIHVASS